MIYYDFRTGDSRGFAFVRYKYADEAQKAVEKLDGILTLEIFIFCFVLCIWAVSIYFFCQDELLMAER